MKNCTALFAAVLMAATCYSQIKQPVRIDSGLVSGVPGRDPSITAVTTEQRAAWAKEGSDAIDAAVKLADIRKIAQSLQDHDRFTREYLIPKFDGLLP